MKTEYKSRIVTLNMTQSMYDDVKAVSDITGRTVTDILVESVSREIERYKNPSGHVKPIKAVRMTGLTDYEKAVAKAEGHTPEIEEHECYVLDETTMYGDPYYVVYDKKHKNIVKVPKSHVKLIVGGVM